MNSLETLNLSKTQQQSWAEYSDYLNTKKLSHRFSEFLPEQLDISLLSDKLTEANLKVNELREADAERSLKQDIILKRSGYTYREFNQEEMIIWETYQKAVLSQWEQQIKVLSAAINDKAIETSHLSISVNEDSEKQRQLHSELVAHEKEIRRLERIWRIQIINLIERRSHEEIFQKKLLENKDACCQFSGCFLQ